MTKKIGFFKKPQGVFTEEFIKEVEDELRSKEGVELFTDLDYREAYVKNGEAFIGDFNLNQLNVYFWHDIVHVKLWKGDNYILNVLSALEKDCVIVNSVASSRIVNDKYLSHLKLLKAGLPVSDFSLVNIKNRDAVKSVFRSMGSSVLLKPRYGGFGSGIVKVDSEERLFEVLEFMQNHIESQDQQILIEKFYENDIEKWTSVVVFGDKILFGYRKKVLGDSDWKVYDPERKDAKGQFTDYVEVGEDLADLALRAKDAIGKDIICFDFIHTSEGYKIIDENGRPGLYRHCLEAARIDLKKEVVDLILSKLNKD